MRRNYNRRIRPSWDERHPVASAVLGTLVIGVGGYIMAVLVFCL